jgi:hypothetical protein
MDAHDDQRDPDTARILDGIRSLHTRMDELEGRVMAVAPADLPGSADPTGLSGPAGHPGRAGPGGQVGPLGFGSRRHLAARLGLGFVPAWLRPTEGEARWPAALAVAAAAALQYPLPGRLVLLHPVWLLPTLEILLLAGLVAVNPRRINTESRAIRLLSLTLAAVLSLANAYSVARLVIALVNGTEGSTPGPLLVTGGTIWLTNVIVFGLWYWEFDRGGPVARAHADRMYPDFLFAQMVTPKLAQPDWEPAFGDYLYLSFTNATAFSPTDVLPLSRWAKMGMTVQASVSIVTVALVVARAVNILK